MVQHIGGNLVFKMWLGEKGSLRAFFANGGGSTLTCNLKEVNRALEPQNKDWDLLPPRPAAEMALNSLDLSRR